MNTKSVLNVKTINSAMERVICKLNIKKAHDHVNWDYLIFLTEIFGFGSDQNRSSIVFQPFNFHLW